MFISKFIKRGYYLLGILVIIALSVNVCFASEGQQVLSVDISGNEHITSQYISGILETKAGVPFDRDMLQRDIDAIYAQGFFTYVDADIRQEGDGVIVTYSVSERPLIQSITFKGNTVFKDEALIKEVFSQVGSVFNNVFFNNDLNRIQELYHKAGYVMVHVADVNVEGGNIEVTIIEPRLGDIIIQGNKKTKTNVIRREIKMKPGDLFNITHFRHQLGKLQGLGYFEDVNVGYDSHDGKNDVIDLILTVKEKKTASIGLNLAYGTESGFSGGLTYGDTNLNGKGYNLDVGFDLGDESRYWANLSSPYMDSKTYAWRVGVYHWDYKDNFYNYKGDKQFEYDEKGLSFSAGIGKKFGRKEDWSWFLTLRHQDVEYSNVHNAIPNYQDDLTQWGGKNMTAELQVTLDKRDPYLPYPKGFVWDTNLEQAIKILGGEFSYLKYWTQLRYYLPLNKLVDSLIDVDTMWTDESPILFAARLRVGSATEDYLPAFARYSLGGMNSLRGYRSRTFEGSDMWLGNFEIRIPVQKNFSIVGFYDIGNADINMDWGKSYDNYGMGVRVKTPMGNLRLDYAVGDDENRTYFGFGEMF